jgi:hypothetical protein
MTPTGTPPILPLVTVPIGPILFFFHFFWLGINNVLPPNKHLFHPGEGHLITLHFNAFQPKLFLGNPY